MYIYMVMFLFDNIHKYIRHFNLQICAYVISTYTRVYLI